MVQELIVSHNLVGLELILIVVLICCQRNCIMQGTGIKIKRHKERLIRGKTQKNKGPENKILIQWFEISTASIYKGCVGGGGGRGGFNSGVNNN